MDNPRGLQSYWPAVVLKHPQGMQRITLRFMLASSYDATVFTETHAHRPSSKAGHGYARNNNLLLIVSKMLKLRGNSDITIVNASLTNRRDTLPTKKGQYLYYFKISRLWKVVIMSMFCWFLKKRPLIYQIRHKLRFPQIGYIIW